MIFLRGLFVWLSLTAANFFCIGIGITTLHDATERSFFQFIALLVFAISMTIVKEEDDEC